MVTPSLVTRERQRTFQESHGRRGRGCSSPLWRFFGRRHAFAGVIAVGNFFCGHGGFLLAHSAVGANQRGRAGGPISTRITLPASTRTSRVPSVSSKMPSSSQARARLGPPHSRRSLRGPGEHRVIRPRPAKPIAGRSTEWHKSKLGSKWVPDQSRVCHAMETWEASM